MEHYSARTNTCAEAWILKVELAVTKFLLRRFHKYQKRFGGAMGTASYGHEYLEVRRSRITDA